MGKLKVKIGRISRLLGTAVLMLYSSVAMAQEITAIDFNGDLIGKVIPDGKVVSFENQLIGNITADSLIVDFDGRLIGGVIPRGIAIGNDNRMLGKVNNDGTVRLSTGKIIGKVLPNGLVVDDRFEILGSVLFPGLIYDDNGQTVGRLTGDGMYANLQGQTIGFVSPDGYAYKRSGNDFILEGRLISSKMVIDAVGRFIGSVSPGGKVTDFEGRQIGFIKANGFAYDEADKVIGSIVKSGYAFDISGKYIGLVTYNGEVINNEKLIGYLQIDGSIADTGGNTIGFMADIAATAADSSGKYLGRIMPEGKIARGRNIVGRIGPWNVIFDADGKQIGKVIASGPIFDYRGALRAHALKNGQVILPNGTPLGIMRGDFALNSSGKVIGATLESKVVVDDNNKPLGVTGINSVLSKSDEKRIVSPFGYVYSPEGGIDGNTVALGGIYSLNGTVIGAISPNGEITNRGAVQSGRLTQYGFDIDKNNKLSGGSVNPMYAVNFRGGSLGVLADGNQVLSQDLKPLAKILPDGSVVSTAAGAYMPVIGYALQAKTAVSYDGMLLGYADNQGLIYDAGAAVAGRVNSQGIVLDNAGEGIGEVLGLMPVINGRCDFIGTVTPGGDVKNYREVSMGIVLPNRQVISEGGNVVGFAIVPGSVTDFGGQTVGMVSSKGKVINYSGESLGCVDWQNRLHNKQGALIGVVMQTFPVIDFDSKIIGRTLIDGSVVNQSGQNIGYATPDDVVNSRTGTAAGMVFKYRYAFDNNNKYMGLVNEQGEVIDGRGQKLGTVDFDGNVNSGSNAIGFALYDMYMYNNEHNAVGYIASDGSIISFTNQRIGKMIKGFAVDNSSKMFARGNRDFFIRNKQNEVIGELNLDGKVIAKSGEQIGTLGVAGDIEATDGQIIATAKPLQFYEAEKRRPIYDAEGNVIGYVGSDNKIVDAKGNFIGMLNQDGSAVSHDGQIIGNTKLDWYEKPTVVEQKLPEVGTIKVQEKDYKRSVNIALTPDGEYLGDILEDGSVINKSGKVLGKLLPDGLVVDDQGSLIGIEESAKGADKGEIFVPAGTFGEGGAYGTGDGPGNLGPGGGFGPGERYDVQRSAALSAAQGVRRQNMEVGKISTSYSREAFDGKQKDWGVKKVISTLPVDMDMMILADKPIPAVIARSIDTEHEVPVTAFVERNVYAEDGRNVIIPAGSRLLGSCGGGSGAEDASASARIAIQWDRLIMPNGVMFDISSAQSGDAQGRGGVLGYLDRQLVKKYAMPFATSLANNGMAILFSTDENSDSENETSKQQAMNDAREGFLDDTKAMFNQILADRSNIRAITFIPAGTRIIVYPKVDLWLRTADNAADGSDNEEYKDVLIDDKKTSNQRAADEANRKANFGKGGGSSSVVYEGDSTDAQPAMALVDDTATSGGAKPAVGATPPPPPSTGVVTTNRSSGVSSGSSDVPQLF
ncbi:MAG: TrbI/VirB10 family protein [Alphaproteobacteria bacterium]|nr:TrbI/VirB10 family protein [Alphaproteobacteria bacterium]